MWNDDHRYNGNKKALRSGTLNWINTAAEVNVGAEVQMVSRAKAKADGVLITLGCFIGHAIILHLMTVNGASPAR